LRSIWHSSRAAAWLPPHSVYRPYSPQPKQE
jgi:hypothetical protein